MGGGVSYCYRIPPDMKCLQKHRLFHWIAAFAILMGALAPAFSQAVAFAKGDHSFTQEICSAAGHKIQIYDDSDTTSDQVTPLDHCPYCVVHSDFLAPTNLAFKFVAPTTFAFFPPLFYQSPKPLTAWVTPPSAAPPTQT